MSNICFGDDKDILQRSEVTLLHIAHAARTIATANPGSVSFHSGCFQSSLDGRVASAGYSFRARLVLSYVYRKSFPYRVSGFGFKLNSMKLC
jgi:hypothetical protein